MHQPDRNEGLDAFYISRQSANNKVCLIKHCEESSWQLQNKKQNQFNIKSISLVEAHENCRSRKSQALSNWIHCYEL